MLYKFAVQTDNVVNKNKVVVIFPAKQSEGDPQWPQGRSRLTKRRVVMTRTTPVKQSDSRPSWRQCTGEKQLQPEQMFQEMGRVCARMCLVWGDQRLITSAMLTLICVNSHFLVQLCLQKKQTNWFITQQTNVLPGLRKLFRQDIRKAQSRLIKGANELL